jgi:hypothetical protein
MHHFHFSSFGHHQWFIRRENCCANVVDAQLKPAIDSAEVIHCAAEAANVTAKRLTFRATLP